jgi:hypothetical protein
MLATSRVPLQAQGERVVRVPPLALPAAIPLALTLAAGRAALLGVSALAEDNVPRLADPDRRLLDSFLRSWRLADGDEQRILVQCAAFADTVELADLVAMGEEPYRLFGAVDRLERMGLLEPELAGEPRFRVLTVVRDGALTAVEPRVWRQAQERHATRFARMGNPEELGQLLASYDRAEGVDLLAAALPELVAAARRCLRWGDLARAVPLLMAGLHCALHHAGRDWVHTPT